MAVAGSKYERNIPAPILDRIYTQATEIVDFWLTSSSSSSHDAVEGTIELLGGVAAPLTVLSINCT